MACAICDARRPRRFCPGVRGDICAICCGTEREVTVDCPFDCEYLLEARRREKPVPVAEADIPNRDIEVTDRLVEGNEQLLRMLAAALVRASLETGAIDADVREALEALVRTYRTLQSGVYYETRPAGPFAGAIYGALQSAAQEFRAAEQRQLGYHPHARRRRARAARVSAALSNGNVTMARRGAGPLSIRCIPFMPNLPRRRPGRSSLILP